MTFYILENIQKLTKRLIQHICLKHIRLKLESNDQLFASGFLVLFFARKYRTLKVKL